MRPPRPLRGAGEGACGRTCGRAESVPKGAARMAWMASDSRWVLGSITFMVRPSKADRRDGTGARSAQGRAPQPRAGLIRADAAPASLSPDTCRRGYMRFLGNRVRRCVRSPTPATRWPRPCPGSRVASGDGRRPPPDPFGRGCASCAASRTSPRSTDAGAAGARSGRSSRTRATFRRSDGGPVSGARRGTGSCGRAAGGAGGHGPSRGVPCAPSGCPGPRRGRRAPSFAGVSTSRDPRPCRGGAGG